MALTTDELGLLRDLAQNRANEYRRAIRPGSLLNNIALNLAEKLEVIVKKIDEEATQATAEKAAS
jgi:hypothetical protein